jgi:uncharacterized membrane protein YqjE
VEEHAVTDRPDVASKGTANLNTGELIHRATEQLTKLVHDELRLAQAEMETKARRGVAGLGLFGAAAVVALLGAVALVAAAVIGLAHVLAWWLAALAVGGALLAVAGGMALVGRSEVERATPPLPKEAMESVQADVATTREAVSR